MLKDDSWLDYYIYRNNVYYDENEKWHSVNNNLPFSKIDILQEKEVELVGIDNFLIKQGDQLFPYKDGHLLLLGDVTNELYDINTKTGEVNPLLNLRKYITPYDVYNSEIANWDKEKYRIAKGYNRELIKQNRQTLQLNYVKYIDNMLYGIFSIEVVEPNGKEYNYISDEGKKVSLPKGELVLSTQLLHLVKNVLVH